MDNIKTIDITLKNNFRLRVYYRADQRQDAERN